MPKGPARPETSGRYGGGRDFGGQDRDWRNRREIERTIGQSAVWNGWSEGAGGEVIAGGTVGYRQKGGGRTVGVIYG